MNLRLAILFALLHGGVHAAQAAPAGRLSDAQVVARFNSLESLPDFSPKKPLSQTQMMQWIFDLAFRGAFPKPFKTENNGTEQNGKNGGYLDYISRNQARLFVRQSIGRDLKVWDNIGPSGPQSMVGDQIQWYFNTSNSMSEAPFVRLKKRKSYGKNTDVVLFDVWHRTGFKTGVVHLNKIGSGSAVLGRAKNNWIVTTWKVKHDKN